MSSVKDVSLRKWENGDEFYLLDFAEKLNWDVDMHEIRSFMKQDPCSFIVAVGSLDIPIGFIGVTLSAPSLYYISLFIVRDDLRKRGIGRKLWKAMLEKVGDANMCLDAVHELKKWYMVNGFSFPKYKFYYYEVKLTKDMKTIGNTNLNMVPLSEELWPSLLQYDRHVYPNFDREKILRAWFNDEVVKVAIAMKDGIVRGYCCLIHRQTCNQYSLRNGFADDEDVLEQLLRYMLEHLPTESTIRFVLMEGKPLPKYLRLGSYSNLFLQRMYSKEMIDTNTQNMWFGPDIFI